MTNLVLACTLSALFWCNGEAARVHSGVTHLDVMQIIIHTHEHCQNYINGCPENVNEADPSVSSSGGHDSRSRDSSKSASDDSSRSSKNSAAYPCVDGYSASTYPCSNIDMYSHVSLYDLGGRSSWISGEPYGNDVWGWTSSSGKEYALAGLADGTSVVDISDPNNPNVVAFIKSHTTLDTFWRDIKIYQNYVYIVQDGSSGHGLQYVKLDELIYRARYSSDDIYYLQSNDSLNGQDNSISNCHNIFVNEDTAFLYAVGSDQASGGLFIYDVSDPGNPTYAGEYSDDGYTHDVQCVIYKGQDRNYYGKEICFAYNEDSVTVIDVSDKNNIVMIDREEYDNTGYTHQGWIDESHNYLYMDDELDEYYFGFDTSTYAFDISDLSSISLIDNLDPFESATHGSIDHNHYVMGDYLYQAHYRAGIRILDISNTASGSLSEVAYFDTYVTDDEPFFDGVWSVYPYFDSGVLVAQDINKGLFLLKFESSERSSSNDNNNNGRSNSKDDSSSYSNSGAASSRSSGSSSSRN